MNKIMTKKAGIAIAAAAMMIAGCASDDKQDTMHKGGEMGKCHGINSCKGTSACATAESACAGHNSCKGQGWVKMSAADCESKGGKFTK